MSAKTIAVIGGAGGIGEPTAKKYHALGHHVIVGDINESEGDRIKGENPGLIYIPLDITDPQSRAAFLDEMRVRCGGIDHLIQTAGGSLIDEKVPIEELDPDVAEKSYLVNYTGPMLLSLGAIPLLREIEGDSSITYMSSIAAKVDMGLFAYSKAKKDLLELTRYSSKPLGELGIRVNAIVLGTVDTARLRRIHTAQTMEEWRELTDSKVLYTGEDVADKIYEITHEDTELTGAEVLFDNGQIENIMKRGPPPSHFQRPD